MTTPTFEKLLKQYGLALGIYEDSSDPSNIRLRAPDGSGVLIPKERARTLLAKYHAKQTSPLYLLLSGKPLPSARASSSEGLAAQVAVA